MNSLETEIRFVFDKFLLEILKDYMRIKCQKNKTNEAVGDEFYLIETNLLNNFTNRTTANAVLNSPTKRCQRFNCILKWFLVMVFSRISQESDDHQIGFIVMY